MKLNKAIQKLNCLWLEHIFLGFYFSSLFSQGNKDENMRWKSSTVRHLWNLFQWNGFDDCTRTSAVYHIISDTIVSTFKFKIPFCVFCFFRFGMFSSVTLRSQDDLKHCIRLDNSNTWSRGWVTESCIHAMNKNYFITNKAKTFTGPFTYCHLALKH